MPVWLSWLPRSMDQSIVLHRASTGEPAKPRPEELAQGPVVGCLQEPVAAQEQQVAQFVVERNDVGDR